MVTILMVLTLQLRSRACLHSYQLQDTIHLILDGFIYVWMAFRYQLRLGRITQEVIWNTRPKYGWMRHYNWIEETKFQLKWPEIYLSWIIRRQHVLKEDLLQTLKSKTYHCTKNKNSNSSLIVTIHSINNEIQTVWVKCSLKSAF